ncbi:TorF family putative porin [Variovorax sp. AFSI2.2]|uniref:TorF family putative porin n=1 Tax=Variovorax sp. AFSI2.2 TaxID=3384160 RepID=UPI003EB7E217
MMTTNFTSPPALGVILLVYATASFAAESEDDGVASFAIDTKVTFTSDSRNRGISDSLKGPAARLSVQAAHASGFVVFADFATVNKKQFPEGNGVSATFAGGYRFGNPDGWHFGVGLAAEVFPGAKFSAPQSYDAGSSTPGDFRTSNYNTNFALLEVGYGAFEARVFNVLSRTYRGADTGGVCGSILQFSADPQAAASCYGRGNHGTRGTLLLDLDYKYELTSTTVLNLHAGHQRMANFSEGNFTDYRIGLTHKRWGYEWNVDWVTTRTKAVELYLVQDGDRTRRLDRSAVVLSVSRSF